MKKRIFFVLFFCSIFFGVNAQYADSSRIEQLEEELVILSRKDTNLNNMVSFTTSGVALRDFMRAVARKNNINMSVDPDINSFINYNFNNVKIIDLLLFIAKKYSVDYKINGSIIEVVKYKPPKVQKKKENYIKLKMANNDSLMHLDVHEDTLLDLVKALTKYSSSNIVVSPLLHNKKVSVYLENISINEALKNLAKSNGFYVIERSRRNFFLTPKINKSDKDQEGDSQIKLPEYDFSSSQALDYNVKDGIISLFAVDVPLKDLITIIARETGDNFLMYSDIQGNTSMYADNVMFQEFLRIALEGTDFSYSKDGPYYLIGLNDAQLFRDSRMISLSYRSVNDIVKYIPAELKEGVEILEFTDLNSIIVSGNKYKVDQINEFVLAIDKKVPMILIEVLIVDYSKGTTVNTGVQAGLSDGQQPVQTTQGSLLPGINIDLSSSTINELIAHMNGFGIFNLGKVTPEFYLSLNAMEDKGVLKVRSTPKLATMNGNEASMRLGNTEYYIEERTDVIGTQNPQNITTRTYQPVSADFSLTILPVVAGDDQVILDINVQQSDFTSRISADAPPGKVTRNFQSKVRIKNGEMILLGGLEEKKVSDASQGVPFLSRVPVIRWFFSSVSRQDNNEKLNLFIRPIVIK